MGSNGKAKHLVNCTNNATGIVDQKKVQYHWQKWVQSTMVKK